MMKKVMIWPDIYREQGHWLPAINLAKTLLDEGYGVEFMGIPDCKGVVDPYHAVFHTILEDIYPVGHTLNDRLEPIGQRWKPHHLLPLSRGALDSLFTGASRPDLLVVGYFACLEGLILSQKYNVPLVILTTYLRHPDDLPHLFAKMKMLHLDLPVAQKIIDQATNTTRTTLDTFLAPLVDAPEMIPCAREFDYYDADWEHRASTVYVEPMIERVSLDGEEPVQRTETLVKPIPATGKKLIYGTSGSQVADYEDKAKQLFDGLIGMMSSPQMSDYHLVLAMGEKLKAEYYVRYGVDKDEKNNRLPSNVTLSAWISQLDILKRAEVVFMHGGLATIKESIWEEVPIVILPHGKDQTDNAMRIERTGVGIVAQDSPSLPATFRQYLMDATSNKWIKQRLKKMREIFRKLEAAEEKESVKVIRNVVAP